jgi:hypothetical protein
MKPIGMSRPHLALALALSLSALLGLSAAPAQATKTHLFLEEFGSAAQPDFSRSTTVALDPATNTLLVADPHGAATDAGTISRFNLDGTPADFPALGTNTIDGKGVGDQTPQNGLTIPEYGEYMQIAIDNSGTITDGNIYVTQGNQEAGNLIDVFAPSGEYLGQLTGAGPTEFGSLLSPCGVAVDGTGNLFVGAGFENKVYKFDPSAPVPQAGDLVATYDHSTPVCGLAAGAGPTSGSIFATAYATNQFVDKDNLLKLSGSDLSLQAVPNHDREPGVIAIDPTNGHLYVREVRPDGVVTGVINELDVSGSTAAPVSSFRFFESPGFLSIKLSGIAVDGASGKLYMSSVVDTSRVIVYGPLVTVPDVITGTATITGDTSVTLNGTVDPDGVPLEECRFEYGLTSTLGQSIPCAETVGEIGTSKKEVHAELSGLDPESTYHYRLVAKNVNASIPGEKKTFKTPAKPAIIGLWSQDVAYSEATLEARINPENSPTTYRIEWGPDSSYGNATAEIAIGSGEADHVVSLPLNGLEPGATYHYRVVATNGIGTSEAPDHALTTYPALSPPKSDCPNQAFRAGASARLPECRAYEMVSPVDKNGGDIKVPVSIFNYPARLEQSAEDGSRYAYSSGTAFGDAVSAPWTSSYIATRNAGQGWSTHAISPPRSSISLSVANTVYKFDTQYKAYSPDLSSGWLFQDSDTQLDECADPGFQNLYRRDTIDGSYEALVPEKPISVPSDGYGLELQGLSADGSHAVFRSNAKLTNDAANQAGFEIFQVYEHVRGEGCGELRLVSVLPNGNAAPPGSSVGTAFGISGEGRESNVTHAVSADGNRIYWSRTDAGTNTRPLYVRVDGQETTLVSGGLVKFWTASLDGSKAFYSIEDTGSPLNNNLYEFDLASKSSTLIAAGSPGAAAKEGVVGASEDAGRLYFVSKQALAGAAQADRPNLYLREGGETRFIATVSSEDFGIGPHASTGIVGAPPIRGVRVTPDGGTLVFSSTAALTDYDNKDAAEGRPAVELYRYEASGGELSCVSCNPSGSRPEGEDIKGTVGPNDLHQMLAAKIPGWENQLYAPRALSADGKRLFFESYDSLLPRDANGKADVYEWQAADSSKECEEAGAELYVASSGGCLSLISSGLSTTDSELADASLDGSDVFIRTASSLLPQDPGQVDLYDARVNGGLPIPAGPPANCEGEACQGPAAAPNDPTPSSAGYQGAENVREGTNPKPHCKKGKVRRKGRCVPKKHRARKHHLRPRR